jgi:hypothetical protein
LIDTQKIGNYQGNIDFDNLPECLPLSIPLNRGYLPNTVIQVSPGETELFVRWDRLSSDFVKQFPVVVVSVELFGADVELLGAATITEKRMLKNGKCGVKRGKYQIQWLKFMAERANRGDFSIMFSRWCTLGHETGDPFEAGQRYIQITQDGKLIPDLNASSEFREVLNTVVQWSRQMTVDFMRVK